MVEPVKLGAFGDTIINVGWGTTHRYASITIEPLGPFFSPATREYVRLTNPVGSAFVGSVVVSGVVGAVVGAVRNSQGITIQSHAALLATFADMAIAGRLVTPGQITGGDEVFRLGGERNDVDIKVYLGVASTGNPAQDFFNYTVTWKRFHDIALTQEITEFRRSFSRIATPSSFPFSTTPSALNVLCTIHGRLLGDYDPVSIN